MHGGPAGKAWFALDGIALEGPWPGRPDRLLDDSGLGKYRFEVRDGRGGSALLARLREHLRRVGEHRGGEDGVARLPRVGALPRPRRARCASCSSSARKAGAFQEVWSVPVDPGSPLVDRAPPPAAARVWAVVENGPPADKVDLLLLGDGYTAGEMEKWHRDAKRMAELLFAVSPFKEHRQDFNVWAIDVPSDLSGVSRPSDGVYRRTPLGATYDAFGSERYVLTFDNKKMREIAAAAPYEFVEIVVNDRKYGGGGIHNLYATVAADSAWAPYLFVHEFGHHFAGLADEYYTSPVSYEPSAGRPEPWEPNATADPRAGRVARPRHPRRAAADAVAQGRVRGQAARVPGPAPEDPRGEAARRRDGRALPGGAGLDDAAARPLRGPGGGVRGGAVRGHRLLSAAGGLHHVHARRGRLLRGVPARHRAHHRHVRAGLTARPGRGISWARPTSARTD